MDLEKIKDVFLFRKGTEEDNESNQPVVTTGSIVWGLVLRSAIIIFLSIIIVQYYEAYKYWWVSLFALWFLAAWPAYLQWQTFSKRMEKFEEDTLCGTCRHFDPSSQMCKIYDEFVSKEHVPCEGMDWEPKP